MVFKYKFGIPEVFAMVIGTLLLVGTGATMRALNIPFVTETEAVVIAVVAALFGPTAGGVVTVATEIVYLTVFQFDTDPAALIAFLLLAIMIGHYADDFYVREGKFEGRKILNWCVTYLVVQGFAWMFMIPFLRFLFTKENLFDMLWDSLSGLGFICVALIIITPVFYLASVLMRRSIEKNRIRPVQEDGLR
ncbi:MAG: hypothetical protein IKS87_03010 [Lachnospiraceae bacterium]|nr:hypothetical protein [Lachnospiraceae bacterium]